MPVRSGQGSLNKLFGSVVQVESITDDKTMSIYDSGGYFLLAAITGSTYFPVTITLPELEKDYIGVNYTFTVTKTWFDADVSSYKFLTGDTTDSTGDTFVGYAFFGHHQNSDELNGANGRMIAPVANDSRISLDSDSNGSAIDTGGRHGTTLKLTAINATQWYCEATVFLWDVDGDGSNFFVNS